MKVSLIGAGGIGKAHSNAYSMMEDVKVISVVDTCKENADSLAEIHQAKAYYSLRDMLENEKPDMVDICLPSYLHSEMAVMCMDAKLNTLCEKPLANSMEDAYKILEAYKRNGIYLMIAQIIRFSPEYVYLKRAYEDKTLGDLKYLHFNRMCQAPKWGSGWYTDPSMSGLAPFELHIHDTDFIYYMFGKPKAVKSRGFEDPEFYNSFIGTEYIYDNSIIIQANGGWYGGPLPFSAEYRAVFDKGVIDLKDNILTVYPLEGEKYQPELNTTNVGNDINLKNSFGIYNEIMYFVNCIREGRPVEVIPPEESLDVLNLLHRELESCKSGKVIMLA